MEKRKEEIESKLKKVKNRENMDQDEKMTTSSDTDSDNEDIPEFIDWRSKKSLA